MIAVKVAEDILALTAGNTTNVERPNAFMQVISSPFMRKPMSMAVFVRSTPMNDYHKFTKGRFHL